MRKLVTDLEPGNVPRNTAEVSARQVLELLGWQKPAAPAVTPLCSFLACGKLVPGTHGADVRIAVEALTKEVLLALAWDLPRGLEGLEQLVRADVNIEVNGRFRDARASLMLGNATRWFRAVPADTPRATTRDAWIAALEEANDVLKDLVHDRQPAERDRERFTTGGANLIQRLLDSCRGLIRHAPWHLVPVQRMGTAPVVVAGEAWSHTEGKRTIHVLLWEDDRAQAELLVWNPSGLNPVMAQPCVLSDLLA